jgi:hypothetical protein
MAYLSQMEETDLSGLESYCLEKVRAKSIAWFPLYEYY